MFLTCADFEASLTGPITFIAKATSSPVSQSIRSAIKFESPSLLPLKIVRPLAKVNGSVTVSPNPLSSITLGFGTSGVVMTSVTTTVVSTVGLGGGTRVVTTVVTNVGWGVGESAKSLSASPLGSPPLSVAIATEQTVTSRSATTPRNGPLSLQGSAQASLNHWRIAESADLIRAPSCRYVGWSAPQW